MKSSSTETRHGQKTRNAQSIVAQNDIVDLILEDHMILKELIKTLKNTDADINKRRAAYDQFAPALISHAKPEEESLYVTMKKQSELREEAFEGDVEHQLADQLVEEIKRTDDEDLWSARVKVLAELVEHHIEEEESELLPDYKKHSKQQERYEIGELFLMLKTNLLEQGGEDSPEEVPDETRH